MKESRGSPLGTAHHNGYLEPSLGLARSAVRLAGASRSIALLGILATCSGAFAGPLSRPADPPPLAKGSTALGQTQGSGGYRVPSSEAMSNQDSGEHPTPLPYWRDALATPNAGLALCSEKQPGSGILEVYRTDGTLTPEQFLRRSCPQSVRKAERIGLMLFGFSCRSPWEPIARAYFATSLANRFLYPSAQTFKVTLAELSAVTAQASVTGNAEERASWRLVDTWVRSARLKGEWPTSAPALFIEDDKDTTPFREYEAALRAGKDAFAQWTSGGWVADLTPSWRLTTQRKLSSSLVSRARRKNAVQELLLMGDLAEHSLVAAIMGGLDFNTSLALKDAYYTSVQGRVSVLSEAPESPTSREKKTAQFVFKRLRAIEPLCPGQGYSAEETLQRLRGVHHMRPAAYTALQKLAQTFNNDQSAVLNLMALTGAPEEEAERLADRTITAAQILKRACQNGSLKLDIDLETYLRGDRELFQLARSCGD